MSVWGNLAGRYEGKESEPHKILALDGGGIRGIMTLEVLARMEEILAEATGKGAKFRLCQFFDYIGGTSTGAIIAAGLARGMSARELIDFYVATGPAMFDKQFLLKRWRALYKSEPLKKELQKVYGAKTTLKPDDLKCLLLAVTRNRTTDSPWPISSNPQAKYNDLTRKDCNLKIPLWQIVRASTAAPVFFPPEVIQWDPKDPTKAFVFVDGGVTPYNNPASLLYRMATEPGYRLNWATGEDKLLVMSIGTGAAPTVDDDVADPGRGLVGNIAGIPGALMYGAMVDQDVSCRHVGRCVHGAPIDREVGTMIPRAKLGTDLGKRFLYARYNADLSKAGLRKLGLPKIDPKAVSKLDSIAAIGDLRRVGRAVAREVQLEHFGPFVYVEPPDTMRAFIVRPFGTKEGIDFDQVERELIAPAIKLAGFGGGTTAEFIQQGNIRTDMFEQLLLADLVIADLSIHNANVFYELGIRHAFRDKRTILLKSQGDDVPFDLKTDRYFSYDRDDPAKSLDPLVAALKATWVSQDQDSPVFQLLPGLPPADPSILQVLPTDFQEEVALATEAKNRAHLQLLAMEADGLGWKVAALRRIARAQRVIGDLHGERLSWEAVRVYDEMDVEANTELGTVYQRLGNLVKSDNALGRAIQGNSNRSQRAEVRALMARNAKARWLEEWNKEDSLPAKQETALTSGHLEDSFEYYRMGFREDRNHFYSGLNALAMVTVITELATLLPESWDDGYDSEDEAALELRKLKQRREELAAAVKLAIETKREELHRTESTNIWLEISYADLICLTSSKPRRVAREYKKALAGAQDFECNSARSQLLIYEALGILPENTKAGLDIIPAHESKAKTGEEPSPRVLLFTGHRIDAPGRKTPRFPADREDRAREMILEAVEAERSNAQGDLLGIAGGASGGDILFHEVCAEAGIPSRMFLVLPRAEYVKRSVQDAGADWVERFNRLYKKSEHEILSDSTRLPRWLQAKKDYSVWNRSNLWMLNSALAHSEDNTTLIALWNGQKGDGPGGTEDMVHQAQSRGAKFVRLDARQLLEPA